MGAIALRPALPADALELGALHVASWQETYAGLLPKAMLAEQSAEARAAMWASVLADPDAFGDAALFVAEEDGQILGFASCADQRDPALAQAGFGGEIGAIYVLRAHQGKGIGRLLMTAIARALSERGYQAASLWVLEQNVAARAFYDRLGGTTVAKRSEPLPDATLTELAYGFENGTLLANKPPAL